MTTYCSTKLRSEILQELHAAAVGGQSGGEKTLVLLARTWI